MPTENPPPHWEPLFESLYRELRAIASRELAQERPGHTLQPTALVNEVYLKFMRQEAVNFTDRNHFRAIAAAAMRQVLKDWARGKLAAKRSGERDTVEVSDIADGRPFDPTRYIDLDSALDTLSGTSAVGSRQARLVEMVSFGGTTMEEAARFLNISERTAFNDWRDARRWLRDRLQRA
jgi:RNA polymerase sigma-70 factor (ECF subfamily)